MALDVGTKKALAAIPLLKTKAGPRDKEEWPQRLKEEVTSLIKVGTFLAVGSYLWICTVPRPI